MHRYNKSSGGSQIYRLPEGFEIPNERYFKDADAARGIFGSLVGPAWFTMITEELRNAAGPNPNVNRLTQFGSQIRREARTATLKQFGLGLKVSNLQTETPPWTIALPGETNGIINVSWDADGVDATTFSNWEAQILGDDNSRVTSFTSNAILTGLSAGARTVLVRAAFNNGYRSTWYNVNATVPAKTDTPPSPVTNLQAQAISDNQIRLTWTNPPNTDLKDIRIQATGLTTQFILASATPTVTFTVGLNSTITFTVQARDNGNELSTAATVMASPLAPAPPNEVSNVSISSPSSTSLKIDWSDPDDSRLSGIRVTRNDTSATQDVASGTETITYTGLTTGTTYSFNIQTYRLVGSTRYYSTGVGISSSTGPGAVTNLQANATSDTQIRVSWNAPTTANYSHTVVSADIASYTPDPPNQTIQSTSPQRADFTVPLSSSVTFSVTAYNTSNVPSTTLTVTGSPQTARTPNPVANLTSAVSQNGTTITLSWTDNTDIPINGIRVSNTTNSTTHDVDAGTQTFAATGLTAGSTYTFDVQSYRTTVSNTRIYSSSTSITVVADSTPPGEVTGILIFENGLLNSTANTIPVRMTWTDPTDSDLNDLVIESYPTATPATKVTATVDEGVEGYNVTIGSTQEYTFNIKTRDDAGNLSSGANSTFTFAPPTAASSHSGFGIETSAIIVLNVNYSPAYTLKVVGTTYLPDLLITLPPVTIYNGPLIVDGSPAIGTVVPQVLLSDIHLRGILNLAVTVSSTSGLNASSTPLALPQGRRFPGGEGSTLLIVGGTYSDSPIKTYTPGTGGNNIIGETGPVTISLANYDIQIQMVPPGGALNGTTYANGLFRVNYRKAGLTQADAQLLSPHGVNFYRAGQSGRDPILMMNQGPLIQTGGIYQTNADMTQAQYNAIPTLANMLQHVPNNRQLVCGFNT